MRFRTYFNPHKNIANIFLFVSVILFLDNPIYQTKKMYYNFYHDNISQITYARNKLKINSRKAPHYVLVFLAIIANLVYR